jgi:hypothetical protein
MSLHFGEAAAEEMAAAAALAAAAAAAPGGGSAPKRRSHTSGSLGLVTTYDPFGDGTDQEDADEDESEVAPGPNNARAFGVCCVRVCVRMLLWLGDSRCAWGRARADQVQSVGGVAGLAPQADARSASRPAQQH